MGCLVIAAVALLGLYCAGKLPVRMLRAAAFAASGSWKESCIGASFTRCSGSIHRVLRVKECRSYSFSLSGHVRQGALRAELTADGKCLLTLTPDCPAATLPLERGRGYRLSVRFEDASGDYQLEWG